jgi:hypothetical protein
LVVWHILAPSINANLLTTDTIPKTEGIAEVARHFTTDILEVQRIDGFYGFSLFFKADVAQYLEKN